MSHDLFSVFSSAELQSALSSEVFHAMLNTMPVAVTFLKAQRGKRNNIDEFVYLFANRPAERMAGTTLAGKILLYEHDSPLFNKLAAVVNSGIPHIFIHQSEWSGQWLHYTLSKFDDGVLMTYEDITKEKNNTTALLRGIKKLAEAERIGHVGSFEWTRESSSMQWSDEMYRIYGLVPGSRPASLELLLSLIHPEDALRIRKKFDDHMHMAGSEEFTTKLKLEDGNIRHVWKHIESERDESGVIAHILGFTLDLTERKKIEDELRACTNSLTKKMRESNRNSAMKLDYERIVNNSHEAILSLDGKGYITMWNGAAEKLYGFTADEAIGRHIGKLIVAEANLNGFKQKIQMALDGETVADYRTTKRNRNHDEIDVLVNLFPMVDGRGKVNGVAATMTRISADSQNGTEDESLNEQAKLINSIANASPDILFVMNLQTKKIVYTNHSAAETLGYTQREIDAMENPILDIMYDADIPRMLKHIEDMKTAGDDEVREIEYRLMHSDGTISWFRDRNTVFKRDKDGIPVEKLGICHNITERKLAAEEIGLLNDKLREKNRDLQSINDELKTFTSIAASDYKQTLQTLYTNLEYIISNDARNFSNTGKANLRKAQTAIQKMKLLTDDIVSFSKIQSMDTTPMLTDLNVVIANVREELAGRIAGAQATFEVEQLPTIMGYPLLLDLLFFHIIDNALKFRRENEAPHITISCTTRQQDSKEAQYLISVSDDGMGIPADQTENIFQMFYRLHDKQFKGSGIGLAICRKIMDHHRGSIAVESIEGQHTKVTCSFFA
jgi:PAS domain S-box-containing protein